MTPDETVIEDAIFRFAAACRANPVEDIDPYLPVGSARRPALVGMAKAAIEVAWRAGPAPAAERDAHRAWVEYYTRRYPELREDDTAVGELIAMERACRPPGPIAVTEYATRFPGHQAAVLSAPAGPPRIPGIEILHELGRGACGVVYRARQTDLDREVALKVIPAAGATGVDRFHTEAQAAARLHHPNVVEVHEVGSTDGYHYLVLELVDGETLARRHGGRPVPPREAAQIVRVLAAAVQYAHDHGVIHRDLKPANVLVANRGLRNGEPQAESAIGDPQSAIKVADFGLAKRLDRESEKTGTGAVLGTPVYMAPEQAHGSDRSRPVTPAADTYALGAILYELLTGRPPFQGESAIAVLMQVVKDDPIPPRRLDHRIPVDLETVCLKCLEKRPGDRYARAGDLADDLGRFLAAEPVKVRPVGRTGRAVRWARRNPGLARLGVALAATVLIGLGLVSWQWYRAKNEAAAKTREWERAERSLARARDAIDFIGRRIGDEELSVAPRSERIRKEMIEYALKAIEEFLAEYGHEPAYRAEAARANLRAADLRAHLGDPEAAEPAYHRAIELYEALAAEVPGNPAARAGLITAWNQLATLYGRRNRFADADSAYARMANLLDTVPENERQSPTYRHNRAVLIQNMAWRLARQGRYPDVEDPARQALAELKAVARDDPTRDYRPSLVQTCILLASSLRNTRRELDALPVYAEAMLVLDGLIADWPHHQGYRLEFGLAHRNRARALRELDRKEEARTDYEKAAGVFGSLSSEFPATPAYHAELAEALLGWAMVSPPEPDRWKELLDRGLTAIRRARAIDPGNAQFKRLEIHLLGQSADVALHADDHRRVLDRADELLPKLSEGKDVFVLGDILARSASWSTLDPSLPNKDRATVTEEYITRLATLIRAAREQGWEEWNDVMAHKELKAFLQHPLIVKATGK